MESKTDKTKLLQGLGRDKDIVRLSPRSNSRSPRKRASRFDRLKSESGVALLELGIVLPLFLVTVLVGTVEIGNLINEYQKLTAITREGVRLGSKLPTLEPGFLEFIAPTTSVPTAGITFETPGNATPGNVAPAGHTLIANRIFQLLHLNFRVSDGMGSYLNSPHQAREYEVTTRYIEIGCDATTYSVPANTPCNAQTDGTVEVSVGMLYSSFFFPDFDLIPLRARASGPYLHPEI